jgi:UDP-N-acetylmuramoylalanine--D-glutamate ligase
MKHRLELIKESDGIKFFNDSKATNTASTITALENMKNPTVLILGGSEKGESYDLLFEKIKQSLVKHVVITGASRFNMFDSANKVGLNAVTLTDKFETAVMIADMLADPGDNVLLSPATASFDCFKSYEERGEFFRKIVESLVD